MKQAVIKTTTLADGREITLETGAMARQADGAVLLTCGETILLATAVARKEINVETDFLPLSVDYMEKFAAAGRFPGGFFKRDGRMGDHDVLTSRLIDRAIRPLFPSDYHGDSQVMVQLMSSDSNEQADALACLAASAALIVSDIPFEDPVCEVRIIRKNGEFFVNPLLSDMEGCDLDLMVAATSDSINMVEGEMLEVSEEVLLEALKVAHETIRQLNQLQQDLRDAAGKPKRAYETLEFSQELYDDMEALISDIFLEVSHAAFGKEDRSAKLSEARSLVYEKLTEKYADMVHFNARVQQYFKKIQKKIVREVVVTERKRLDGRALDEIRPIWSEVGLLPRSHGSSLFTRGETQALCTTTLGTKFDEQTIDTATFKGSKRFMLQYTFPGFSTGEVKFNRGPARREVGHGNLAERALKPMIPEDIEYTLRIASHILESNGSSSMASVCGGCLSLMDAGIPIKRPVSGIAMGLITTDTGFAVLSDILGDEDFLGDMDFKVAGTTEGLTACQMDIKIRGLSYEIIEEALAQSKVGRMHILDKMLETMPETRAEMSPYAPRFHKLDVPHEFFGMVIGPGGKIIQEIQKTSNTVINLEEGPDSVGTATITGDNAESVQMAVNQIKALIMEPEVGEIYEAKVKSVMDYGAFVEFLPGKEGLLHISEISWTRLPGMEGVFGVGDTIKIQIVGKDPKSGKWRLSHKVLLEKPEGYEEQQRERRDRGGDRRDRGGDRGGDRGRRNDRGDRGRRD